MSALVARIEDIVRPVAPPERLATLRILTGTFAFVYLLARTGSFLHVAKADANDFAPAGLAKLLSGPLPAAAVYAIVLSTVVLGALFTLGLFFRVTGPAFAASILFLLSYRNSFGMIFHTENLLVMHVLVLALSDSAAALSLDAKRAQSVPAPARRYGFGVQCMGVIAAVAYVLAGVAKLRVSGLSWATGDILRNQIAHDNLRKALLGDAYSPIGAWASQHAWMFPPFAVLTLIIELAAPVALLRGRIARLWAYAIWSFHVGVLAMMWILFPYQLTFIAFAPFFDTEKLAVRVRAIAARGRSSVAS